MMRIEYRGLSPLFSYREALGTEGLYRREGGTLPMYLLVTHDSRGQNPRAINFCDGKIRTPLASMNYKWFRVAGAVTLEVQ